MKETTPWYLAKIINTEDLKVLEKVEVFQG